MSVEPGVGAGDCGVLRREDPRPNSEVFVDCESLRVGTGEVHNEVRDL